MYSCYADRKANVHPNVQQQKKRPQSGKFQSEILEFKILIYCQQLQKNDFRL